MKAKDPEERGDLADVVPLAICMPCIISENIATSLGVANSSCGTRYAGCHLSAFSRRRGFRIHDGSVSVVVKCSQLSLLP